MSQITKQPTLFEVFGRTNTPTVPEINEEALDNLTNALTSSGEDLGKVVLLRSPRAGYGKTLLLQSVNSRLNETFRFLAVEPSGGGRIDGEVVLESVLRQLSEVLPASGGLTEFDLFARRLLALGLKPLLISGEIPSHDREGALFAIENRPIETFDFHHQQAATAHWTQANFEVLGPRLASELSEISRCNLRGCAYWVDLLFRYATTPPEKVERTRLLTEAVFGDLAGQGSSGAEERLQSLFALLGLVEPVVLVFDETEGLSNQPDAGLRVAAFIVQLRQACPGLTVILSVNEDVWDTGLKPLMPGGLEDRLTEFEVSLSELKRSEAEALLESRFGKDAPLVSSKMNWPDPLSARAVLREGGVAARAIAAEGSFSEDEAVSTSGIPPISVPPPLQDAFASDQAGQVEQRLEPSMAFEAEKPAVTVASEPVVDVVEEPTPSKATEVEKPVQDPFDEEATSEGETTAESVAPEEPPAAGSPFEIVPETPTSPEDSSQKAISDPFAEAGSSDFAAPPAASEAGEWSAETAMEKFAASQPQSVAEEAAPPVQSEQPPSLPTDETPKSSPFDAAPTLDEPEPVAAQPESSPSPFQILKEEKERSQAEAQERKAAISSATPVQPAEPSEPSPFSVSEPVAPTRAVEPPVQSPFQAVSAEASEATSSPFTMSEPEAARESAKATREPTESTPIQPSVSESPFEATSSAYSAERASVGPQQTPPPMSETAASKAAPEPSATPREERRVEADVVSQSPPAEKTFAPASDSAATSPGTTEKPPQRESTFAASNSPFAAAAVPPTTPSVAPDSGQESAEVEELLSQFKKRFGQPGS